MKRSIVLLGRAFVLTYFLNVCFVCVDVVVSAHLKVVWEEAYENYAIWALILSVLLLPVTLFIAYTLKPEPIETAKVGDAPVRWNYMAKRIGYAACVLELTMLLYLTLLITRVIER